MTMVEVTLSTAMLGAFMWALLFLLPRARRDRDAFGIACALLTALLGLAGWLLVGIGTVSQ